MIPKMTVQERASAASAALGERANDETIEAARDYLKDLSPRHMRRPEVRAAMNLLAEKEEELQRQNMDAMWQRIHWMAVSEASRTPVSGCREAAARERWLITRMPAYGSSAHDQGFRIEGACSDVLTAKSLVCDESSVRQVEGESPCCAAAEPVMAITTG